MPINSSVSQCETFSYFLPPNSTESDIHCKLYGQGPYIATSTHQDTIKKAQMFDTKEKLYGVLLSWSIRHSKQDSNGNESVIFESSQFCHHEVPVHDFLELVHCCEPKTPGTVKSSKDVRDCWNRVFRGNSSPFNFKN